MKRAHGIDEVRRKSRRIEPPRDWRRLAPKRLLLARDHAERGQPRERASEFSLRRFGMTPRIQARWRLRQTREKDRLAERQVPRRFSKISARRRFRAEPPVAVAAAVQIF